ncbi:protein FAM171A1 isoform X2 [Crotalus tigris]|uniref:protein FAM171A1 isoform X2 n=1 Tax=Crotalus tigris TaxID=88082 RepID=UPI00192F8D74|nr:protein FAM171A1 isoform X2 [Crotalus tigris]
MSRAAAAAALLLCLLGCNVWKAVTKTLAAPDAAQEVTLKVHVSDASTHQPVTEAFIEIFTNQVPIASGNTGADGTAFIKFQYKLDSQLIVTATKQAYVPNSAPWKPVRLPVFSSLSLGLLPERSATLMVYEDVVQIVSGFQGNNTRYDLTPVTAVSVHLLRSDGTPVPVNGPIYVTVPLPATNNLKHHTHVPAWRFDQKLGTWLKSNLGTIEQEGNGLTWTYIASQLGYWVAAMSPTNPGLIVAKDFTTYHTVFLLAILGGIALILLVLLCLLLYYCRRKCLKPRQHHKKLRLSSTPSAKKDQSTSMSHLNLVFSRRESEFPGGLSITGNRHPESSGHNELIVAVHLDKGCSGEVDMHTPMLQHTYSTSQEFSSREESLSHKENDRSRMSLENITSNDSLKKDYLQSLDSFSINPRKSLEMIEGYGSPDKGDHRHSYNTMLSRPLFEKQEQISMNHISTGSKYNLQEQVYPIPSTPETELLDCRSSECMMSRSVDHLERPTSFPRPGHLVCCNSVDQVNDGVYRKVLPTLVIPGHYMKLPGEHPYISQPLSTDQQVDIERLQAELSSPRSQLYPHSQQQMQPQQLTAQAVSQQHLQEAGAGDWKPQNVAMSESVSIPASLNDASLAQMNSEVQLLTEKALMELGEGKPLPHPRAWFVSLDGRSNAHVRHSYIDLQRAGRNGSNDVSLDSGVDMNEPKSARKGRADHLQQTHQQAQVHPQKEQKIPESSTYTQLVYLEEVDQSGSECGTAVCSPEDNTPRCVLEGGSRRTGGQLPSLEEETIKRTVESSPEPLTSPEHKMTEHSEADDDDDNDDDDQGEDKKSPWQKREERPLMAFNLK